MHPIYTQKYNSFRDALRCHWTLYIFLGIPFFSSVIVILSLGKYVIILYIH